MEIRELSEKDLPSLLNLYIQLDENNKNLSTESALSLWKDQIENNKNIKYFGAIDKDTVVSTCYCVIIPNLTNSNQSICFIENVVTDKNYRKQGLTKAVFEKAIDFAKENHCYKVILQSGISRKEAHLFYESIGFNGTSKKAFDMRIQYN